MTQPVPDNSPQEVELTVSGRSLIAQIIYLIASIISGLLIIRFLLSLFGANQENAFADFIYSVTNPFVEPYYGLFSNDFVYGDGTGRFEYEALLALAMVIIIGFILIKVVSLGKRNVQA
jgi:YggT family protein